MTADRAKSQDRTPLTGASAFMQREAKAAKWPKRPMLLALGLATVALAAWAAGSGEPASEAPRDESRPAAATAGAVAAAPSGTELAAIERRLRAATEAAEAEEARLRDLTAKREALQREISELTAPLSPSDAKEELASAQTDETSGRPPAESAASASEATGVRVFIHVRANDPEARRRAASLAHALREQGVDVAAVRGVPRAVRRDLVRFFYDGDEAAAAKLESALKQMDGAAPLTQDFRRRSTAPRRGTLEIWLS
ncbi:hypothetical protein GCM10008171_14580 [Methylopila jiangsuensis]|uniref:Uncharacterized protein n=1 Tax=Methylopila jiangsuensis TaxID=586230 RepID=A0A9W6JI49_9HYPH|nr:hypothetical protein [Methylopila jiangsuensis]MDR6284279.1 hypothetical protein [Methylopila jiangsuensis]GLK76204.1 hypothetical protein GCM10008171_14580 [Methylopila jiangsuensis]